MLFALGASSRMDAADLCTGDVVDMESACVVLMVVYGDIDWIIKYRELSEQSTIVCVWCESIGFSSV